jgi:hypothetical protein
MTAIEERFAEAVAATRPAVHRMHLAAILDDGRWWEIHADQRDMRRAMIAIGTQEPDTDRLGFPRACAWAWLTRHAVIEMGWAQFDAECAEVTTLEGVDPLEAVDPTPEGSDG